MMMAAGTRPARVAAAAAAGRGASSSLPSRPRSQRPAHTWVSMSGPRTCEAMERRPSPLAEREEFCLDSGPKGVCHLHTRQRARPHDRAGVLCEDGCVVGRRGWRRGRCGLWARNCLDSTACRKNSRTTVLSAEERRRSSTWGERERNWKECRNSRDCGFEKVMDSVS